MFVLSLLITILLNNGEKVGQTKNRCRTDGKSFLPHFTTIFTQRFMQSHNPKWFRTLRRITMCHVKKMLKYSLVFKLEKPYLLITKWQEFYSKLSNIQPAKLNRYYNDLFFKYWTFKCSWNRVLFLSLPLYNKVMHV